MWCLMRPRFLVPGLALCFLVAVLVCQISGPTPTIVSISGNGSQSTTIHWSDPLGTTFVVDGKGKLSSLEFRLLSIRWSETADDTVDPSDEATPETL